MRQNGIKLSILVGAAAAAVLFGAYVYSLWAAEARKTREMPVESVAALVRDLRRYHEKRGGFPASLRALEGSVWQPKPRDITPDGIGLHSRGYFYLYGRTSEHSFTLWAVPTGANRDEAPTWFVSASPEAARRWKGGAVTSDQLALLGSRMTDASVLRMLGLVEQTADGGGGGGRRFAATSKIVDESRFPVSK